MPAWSCRTQIKHTNAMTSLWSLFYSFFKIGAFTFGGGYAMIPLIQREVIERKRWLEEKEFIDLLTIAQSAPGPIALNTAVFVGYKLRGYIGSIAAILGVVVPSFAIILIVAIFFSGIRQNPYVDAAFKGMRPAVVALIVYPVLKFAKGINRWLYIVIALAAIGVWWLELSPVWMLLCGAVAGIVWQLSVIERGGKR